MDCGTKTATYTPVDGEGEKTLRYDYLIVGTGIRRPWPVVPSATSFEGYKKDAGRYIERIEKSEERIVVIGGGELYC